MKFRVVLHDPFGTVSGEGQIEMAADSVFGAGVAHVTGLEGPEGRTMTAITLPLTREEHEGQVRQITGSRYAQSVQVPWWIELTEA